MSSKTKATQSQPTAGKHGLRRLFATGFSMGAADLVPGVSGGTIAFLFGIYGELLFSIKTVTGTTLRLLFRGKFKQAWQSIPFHFLLPLLLGILLAVFGLANLISYLLDHHGVFVWSFFFGLVVGSAWVIRKRVSHWNMTRGVALLVGAVGTYFLVGLASGQAGSGPLALFVTGAIAFCAMILPGISGSLIMVIMGQYETVLNAVSDRDIAPLAYLAIGGAFGLALFSRLLSWLLKKYHGVVVAFLVGMMLGSLRKVWPWHETVGDHEALGAYAQQQNVLPALDWSLAACLALFALALVLVLCLEKLGMTKEHAEDIADKSFQKEHKENLRTS